MEADNYQKLLAVKFPYYKLLDEREQSVFVSRLKTIRYEKQFIGHGLAITEEMEIIVSAAIVQLTFGLDQFELESLRLIELTPEAFYSRFVGADVKGLAITGGKLILSWADFEQGYMVADDKINLGLHELAHAFWLNYFVQHEARIDFDEWNTQALVELQKMRDNTRPNFLRNYAATNIEEFWACSVEAFFEAPIEFKRAIPRLYHTLCTILNQDMAAKFEKKAIASFGSMVVESISRDPKSGA